MRRQAEQVAKSMREQTQGVENMTMATQNVAKQINLITRANREHSVIGEKIAMTLSDIRKGSERYSIEIKESHRLTIHLVEQTENLMTLIEQLNQSSSHQKVG